MTTGQNDYTQKRDDYAAFGVPEYWRFDPSGGEYHDAPRPGITWSTASTIPSKLSSSERPPTGATVRRSAWTCAGRTGSFAGTTQRAAAIC